MLIQEDLKSPFRYKIICLGLKNDKSLTTTMGLVFNNIISRLCFILMVINLKKVLSEINIVSLQIL